MTQTQLRQVAPITLYTNHKCPFAQRVRMTLTEMGLTFVEEEIDFKNKPSSFLKLNPEGKVPTIRYGDKTLTESSLILDYLAHEFPESRLLPQDTFESYRVKLFVQKFNEELIPQFFKLLKNQDRKIEGELREQLLSSFDKLEDMLRKQSEGPYFLGKNMSLAEFNCMPFMARLVALKQFRQFDLPKTERFARLHQWVDAINATPCFRKVSESDQFYIDAFRPMAEEAIKRD